MNNQNEKDVHRKGHGLSVKGITKIVPTDGELW